MTRAPAALKPLAIAAPIPFDAPVTTATLPEMLQHVRADHALVIDDNGRPQPHEVFLSKPLDQVGHGRGFAPSLDGGERML
jgi:hypothetical protein